MTNFKLSPVRLRLIEFFFIIHSDYGTYILLAIAQLFIALIYSLTLFFPSLNFREPTLHDKTLIIFIFKYYKLFIIYYSGLVLANGNYYIFNNLDSLYYLY